MKKFLKILWWVILFPILILITYVFLCFIILHSLGWDNLQISTTTSLFLPYVLIAFIGLGIYKVRKK